METKGHALCVTVQERAFDRIIIILLYNYLFSYYYNTISGRACHGACSEPGGLWQAWTLETIGHAPHATVQERAFDRIIAI